MYLDKIRTETRRILKRGFEAFMYDIMTSNDKKLLNIFSEQYDEIHQNILSQNNIIDSHDEFIRNEMLLNLYIHESTFYYNLKNNETEIKDLKKRKHNFLYLIEKEFEEYFIELSLLNEYEQNDRRRYLFIERKLKTKISKTKKGLNEFLKALHSNSNFKHEKISPKTIAAKYILLLKFYKKDNPEDFKDGAMKWYDFIAEKYSLNNVSFRNAYGEIKNERNLPLYLSSKKYVLNSLKNATWIKDYPDIKEFIYSIK